MDKYYKVLNALLDEIDYLDKQLHPKGRISMANKEKAKESAITVSALAKSIGDLPLLVFKNVQSGLLQNSIAEDNTNLFLKIQGTLCFVAL